MIPATPAAFQLMMEGSAALTDVEENGMRIDVPQLEQTIDWTRSKISEYSEKLRQDEIFREWRKVYGEDADLGKRQQLADIMFNRLGYECKVRTKTGAPSTNEEAFEEVDNPFIKRWLDYMKLSRLLSTELLGVQSQMGDDGFLRPFFHLHFASTYRSSSSDPNFQNKPMRDRRLAKLIRQVIVPRTDEYVIVETDYGALEFRGAACFWKDPGMIAYASDPSLDIHRDMAAECYLLGIDDVTKAARGFAKNKFVFPTLYGSYWKNTGNDLWTFIKRAGLTTSEGVCLYEHLKSKGITQLGDRKSPQPGTFLHHIKTVEEELNSKFSHWAEAKRVWWDEYLKNGEFPLMTGFCCRGKYSYNNLMNTPIQGPSFHLLLWSLIEINKKLKKYKMNSRIIGQIHDSIVSDVYRKELDDYIEMSVDVMTRQVRRRWDWIVTPLEVEAEIAEKNWFEKKALVI